jgi:hypothetical protein
MSSSLRLCLYLEISVVIVEGYCYPLAGSLKFCSICKSILMSSYLIVVEDYIVCVKFFST